ncbi:DUF6603 domain-containing protein [Streptomyces sp. S186]|uniref:DUF6603 domain-containing protein n=1 Tax=Streptomyces sp. S186 TaxID=3434395 RepID=UPI003F67064A
MGDLNFSLPLIDSLVPSGDVGIGLQKVAAGYVSQALNLDQLKKIEGLLPGKQQLPPGLQEGGFVSAQLLAGAGGMQELAVSLGGKKALAAAASPPAVWWDVRRVLGPVHVERLGLGYDPESKSVLLLADVAVEAGGLRLGAKGLGVGVPIAAPHVPVFHLDGVSLGYDRPPVTIAGELLRQKVDHYSLAVGGMAVVGTPAVSVTAAGFYGQPTQGGDPSLFLFGVLDLGEKALGPPMFRVQKLAAGFGYHTKVRTPSIQEVGDFPLRERLDKPPKHDTPLTVLEDLLNKKWVAPASDEVWLAAGLTALVYELVDVSAVAIVQFGGEFVAGLYGRAQAQFPKAMQHVETPAWAWVALDVRAEYRSSTDALEIDAALADGSFVVDHACRLTGGAAVRLWFGSSAHPGDFVVTVGGYHPRFHAPPHYPRPARLGLQWHLGGGIYIEGGCYAALTPRAFMAGVKASLHGEFGPAVVDAEVYADALIEWDPLYFDVDWGGSLRARVKPFPAIELSADGRVWGPPVGGHARVNVCGFHVDVDFGHSHRDTDQALTGAQFRERLLPGGKDGREVVHVAVTEGLVAGAGSEPPPQGAAQKEPQKWTVGVKAFEFKVNSAVPATEIHLNGTQVQRKSRDLHIRPMQDSKTPQAYDSPLHVTITGPDNTPVAWRTQALCPDVPAALWGTRADSPEDGLLKGYATGVSVRPPAPAFVARAHLSDDAWNRLAFKLAIPPEQPPPVEFSPAKADGVLDRIKQQITSPSVVRSRDALLAEIKGLAIPGFPATPQDDLSTFAAHVSDYLDASPCVWAP